MKIRLTLERQPIYARTEAPANKITEKTVTVHMSRFPDDEVRTVYWTQGGARVVGRLKNGRMTTRKATYIVLSEDVVS
tara:strand:- start:166 stop:399 length:234 start_codon:yes stop_codon:yes gene_type:complete